MKRKYVWLVTGNTGEYSCACSWNVAAYPTAKEADKHQAAAQNAVKGKECDHAFKNPYDPQCDIDYGGTRYYVEMVELRETFAP